MCEQCLTWPISFGEPLPGFLLMRARRDGNSWKKGEWGLVECNDPTYKWKTTPTPNPLWGMTDEEEDAYYETADRASEAFIRANRWHAPDDFSEQIEDCGPNGGYTLVTAGMQVGYDREEHGQFITWLFDYLGEWLKTAPVTEEDDCFPNREAFAPVDLTIGRDPIADEPGWAD